MMEELEREAEGEGERGRERAVTLDKTRTLYLLPLSPLFPCC